MSLVRKAYNILVRKSMSLKVSLAVALFCLCAAFSNFAAVVAVPPSAGGDGIQAALDAIPAGGEVTLRAGQYLVRHPIVLRKNHQTLRGAGTSTVLFLADGANCPVVVLGSPVHRFAVKDVRLEDLFINGNRKNQQKEVWQFTSDGAGVYNNGVDVWGVNGATVEHIVCCHCRSGGMVTSARTRHLTVRDYTAFDNQFDGLACYLTEDSDFSRLNLYDNLSAGISLDLDFNHNVIHDSVLTGNDLGVFMRQSRDNVFDGLTIQKSRHHGVFMAQTFEGVGAGWHACPGSECTGNRFDHLLVTNCGGKGFVVNDATCTNNVIYGGQFADDAGGGLTQPAPNLVSFRAADTTAGPATLSVIVPGVIR